VGELKSYVKPTGKYPPKKKSASETDDTSALTLQSKIVLLTLTFPRLRIIWASSPYAAADIFNDLKLNNPEPDPEKAVIIGAEEDSEAGSGVNAAAEELLRCLPGITAKNVKYVMGKVRSVRELCEIDLSQVQEVLGVEPGKACWEFMHQGERKP
jgi:DNA excision repair protein ERCC-4